MTMDARKQRILEAIVAIYSTGGEPVGSGLLASHFDMALSSATLRNEMAALTKLGLLEQPAHQRRPRAQPQGVPVLPRPPAGSPRRHSTGAQRTAENIDPAVCRYGR